MNPNKTKTIEGWIDKAGNYKQEAEDQLKSQVYYSESIQSSQQCIELSVKAMLVMMNIQFSKSHGWNEKQMESIAEQILKQQIIEKLEEKHMNYINLPRLIFLCNFWSQFYIQSKYGFESGFLASARDLFKKQDAELALEHASECYNSVNQFKIYGEEIIKELN